MSITNYIACKIDFCIFSCLIYLFSQLIFLFLPKCFGGVK